jgi:hypothetical protein
MNGTPFAQIEKRKGNGSRKLKTLQKKEGATMSHEEFHAHEDEWEELRNFKSLNNKFPFQSENRKCQPSIAKTISMKPITYDEVLDFHLKLKDIKGLRRGEINFFERFHVSSS